MNRHRFMDAFENKTLKDNFHSRARICENWIINVNRSLMKNILQSLLSNWGKLSEFLVLIDEENLLRFSKNFEFRTRWHDEECLSRASSEKNVAANRTKWAEMRQTSGFRHQLSRGTVEWIARVYQVRAHTRSVARATFWRVEQRRNGVIWSYGLARIP